MSNPATGLAGDEVLSVLEAAFRSGLLEIKRIRAAKEPEPLPTRPKPGRKDAPQSRTSNAIDILTQATQPLYIQEILEQLEQRGLPATRDSLVSALTMFGLTGRWSADFRAFSRSDWDARTCFRGVRLIIVMPTPCSSSPQ